MGNNEDTSDGLQLFCCCMPLSLLPGVIGCMMMLTDGRVVMVMMVVMDGRVVMVVMVVTDGRVVLVVMVVIFWDDEMLMETIVMPTVTLLKGC